MSKYIVQVAEGGRSFFVSKEGCKVNISLWENGRAIVLHVDGDSKYLNVDFGLYEFRKILDEIVNEFYRNWKPKERPKTSNGKIFPAYKIEKWSKSKTGKALNARVLAAWKTLLGKADEVALAVQRSYFAQTCKFHNNLAEDDLYSEVNKFVVKDIVNFRAAALLVPNMAFSYGKDKKFLGWRNLDVDF